MSIRRRFGRRTRLKTVAKVGAGVGLAGGLTAGLLTSESGKSLTDTVSGVSKLGQGLLSVSRQMVSSGAGVFGWLSSNMWIIGAAIPVAIIYKISK